MQWGNRVLVNNPVWYEYDRMSKCMLYLGKGLDEEGSGTNEESISKNYWILICLFFFLSFLVVGRFEKEWAKKEDKEGVCL